MDAPEHAPEPSPEPGEGPVLWFGKREGGLGITPLTWQGRAAVFLYVFLVLVALITYSRLSVTAFVIGFYTVVFVLVLVTKSDLMKDWPPQR